MKLHVPCFPNVLDQLSGQQLQPWDAAFFTEVVKSSGFKKRNASSSDDTPDDVILSEEAKRDLQDSIPIYEELRKHKIQPRLLWCCMSTFEYSVKNLFNIHVHVSLSECAIPILAINRCTIVHVPWMKIADLKRMSLLKTFPTRLPQFMVYTYCVLRICWVFLFGFI